jgi:hypothetical protein
MINKQKNTFHENSRFPGITIAMGWQNIDLHDFLYAYASSFNAFVKLLCKSSTPNLIARAQISSCGFVLPKNPTIHDEIFPYL